MTSNDALERIKKRQKPTVVSRDAAIEPPMISQDQASKSQDISTSRHQEVEAPPKLNTKQTTLRMEASVSDRLQTLCRQNKLSREVFIEAMFEHYEQNPALLRAVLEAAQEKNEYRKQLANQKRASSMMKRFGS
jgi:predicted DNA-binding protein